MEQVKTTTAIKINHGGCLGNYRKSAELTKRAAWATNSLDVVVLLARKLFADENFLTLLKAESLVTMPSYLERRIRSHGAHLEG